MTKERLSNLSVLRREITRTKKRLAKLPHSPNSAEHRAKLEQYLSKAEKEAALLLNYINSIEDFSVKEIFMLRYYDGVRSWQRIAFMVGEHDESYVRRKHNKHLDAK